ncbi:MAG: Maf family protein [Clostridia bacterium]|nr:Maf family protein [Clostridia bacterium]
MDIILASASPRRKNLLEQIGLSFQVRASGIDEKVATGLEPGNVAEILAADKARDLARQGIKGLIIGADTIVVQGNDILGKPETREEAEVMLEALQGKSHLVITGVAVIDTFSGRQEVFHETTKVFFRSLTKEEIQAYIASGEPMDKAGAYGIQGLGALLVERLEGCYFNVVGLPLTRLAMTLKGFGVRLL